MSILHGSPALFVVGSEHGKSGLVEDRLPEPALDHPPFSILELIMENEGELSNPHMYTLRINGMVHLCHCSYLHRRGCLRAAISFLDPAVAALWQERLRSWSHCTAKRSR